MMDISIPAFYPIKVSIILQTLLVSLLFLAIPARGADLVFKNGKIWTGNASTPWVELLAVSGDRIVYAGPESDFQIRSLSNPRIVDLHGRLLIPGFNDAHLHFSDGGFALIQLDLRDAKDRMDFTSRVAEYAGQLPHGTWITGGNWDHEAWPDKTYPDRTLIDSVTPSHPVMVNRLDGHLALANSAALKIAGIDENTPDPPGGFIERDPNTGYPTGILKDTAMDLVWEHIPPPSDSIRQKAIEAALKHAAKLGITSVQDMSSQMNLPFYQKLLREDRLTCRILAVLPIEDTTEPFLKMHVHRRFGDAMLRIGSVKTFVDGSMGAGSALFFEPYTDDPSTSGLAIYPQDKLIELISSAHQGNLQVIAHAIGDKANRLLLDAFEHVGARFGSTDQRHRIEHAQVVTEQDLPRFASLNVIASIQPAHCIDDMRWAEKRIGKDRCANAYMVRAFFDSGVSVAFGTDWPVASLDPLKGLYAAVTREYLDGGPEGGWFPAQKITLEQAVSAYTAGSAFAEHEELNKGTLEPGKLADLIVLDRDFFSRSSPEILRTRVDMTVVGGRVVYERE